ncbi:MAG: hypothetical protein RL078_574 [Bacteroidota bacterium]|jgi:hypothetical protein
MTNEEVHKKMNAEEEVAWHESGLSSDGCELDNWHKDAIVRYGRILHEKLLSEMHSLRMQNSGQAALIERYKDKIKMLLSPCGKKVKNVSDL